MNTDTTYDRPREKLQKKGVGSLTNLELLQVLIGTGNAQVSAVKIARKTLKLLSKYGGELTLEQLVGVSGLGVARASLIMASFELASRYPLLRKQRTIDTVDKQRALFSQVVHARRQMLVYVTLDGGKGLIAQRTLNIETSDHPSMVLRDIFSHVVTDQAAGLFIAVGYDMHSLEPSLFELSLARDITNMAQLFSVTVHGLLIVSSGGERSLRGESW